MTGPTARDELLSAVRDVVLNFEHGRDLIYADDPPMVALREAHARAALAAARSEAPGELDAARARIAELEAAVRLLQENWPKTIPAPMDREARS